ncbi:MAG: helix-turn-helix domain-containing protein [Candidatus Thiodiazotropha taylori]|nr:helix-turn-helix transcriptional regulator [Candidatus Thiodiazotropha taylori]MCG8041278.1 helix-turn-helix transcriptional regulator [Candidatus Thiodiazotropha taylori]MCG8051682.1 helix-turn-helix transcriptional regulator [Candidatus Thiodiazotropha taylori]MCG8055868.1 helix-turn-helix transcriptional regulator [Candidatus Thiodiazotropha taylori]MCW4239855.1 helix-turn-helix transcriptional regulator [Candidatus Thiodiazotropha taylori]
MVAKVEHRNRTGCPVACALDIIGDHWTLLIIRNLMFLGLHEYKEMLETEEQISSNILTLRLKMLQEAGLIASTSHPESKRRKLYYLTPTGKDLIHVLVPLVLWSRRNLREHLRIPKDIDHLLETDPQAFLQETLQRLSDWERINLKTLQ